MRSGRRIGVDVGTVRVGIAGCDPDGLLAFAITTIPFSTNLDDAILGFVQEYDAVEVVVGLPRHLNGSEGASAAAARALATQLHIRGLSVRLVDERLSTSSAQAHLYAAGRSAKKQRAIVDQEAARLILQFALDLERTSGSPPGESP